ncbi:hypothetical protein RHMOL_Rhmol07G0163900 [Rhododendron molle]|uniref:Uncharacterized protein n=1 Tax=Rhododendron molle TaxID=49168 RepID=A0ACC0N124_RHOML|nr:hypothetical protein RHMOL_Rhmol07G0163900 [Rhododendron molle]
MHEVLQSVSMLTQDQYGNYVVQVMMKDQFANYVIHKLLESCGDHKLELILNRIKVHLNALKKYTYEKHIVAHVDKLAAAGGLTKKASSFSRLQTLENTEMDDMLDSECSSGCESGWTLYLENSFLSPYALKRRKTEKQSVSEDEEEEDLSMVSDASSGPRIFHEECFGNAGYGFFCHAPLDAALPKNRGKREKKRGNRRREVEEDDPSVLDDTASSPICNFSQERWLKRASEAKNGNLAQKAAEATRQMLTKKVSYGKTKK